MTQVYRPDSQMNTATPPRREDKSVNNADGAATASSRDHRAITQSNKLRSQQANTAIRYGKSEPMTQPIGAKLLYVSAMVGVIGIAATIAVASILHWLG